MTSRTLFLLSRFSVLRICGFDWDMMVNKGRFGPTRRLTDADLNDAVAASLGNLRQLVVVYDSGHPSIAGLMAVEIRKLLSEHPGAVRLRGTKMFPSTVQPPNHNVISAVHELVVARVGGVPPSVEFFASSLGPASPLESHHIEFKKWWNKEIVYRASAAIPGATLKGMIPVNVTSATPFEKRLRMTRMDIVDLVRNKIGAHTETDFPELIDNLESGVDFGSFTIQTPDGSQLSTEDGTLPVNVGILTASIRQIADEILEAYQ